MDNQSALLEILMRVKDDATQSIQRVGSELENTKKSAEGMQKAFLVAGAAITSIGVIGVKTMNDWKDAASQEEVAHAKVKAIIDNLGDSVVVHTTKVQGNVTALKDNKAAIDAQIASLRQQESQLSLNKKAHQNEIDAIRTKIVALDGEKLQVEQTTKVKDSYVTTTERVTHSTQDMMDAVEQASNSYLKLGFRAEDTQTMFAKLLAMTKDTAKANDMLAITADVARFQGIGLDEAEQKLQMAFLGNVRVLKQLGIEIGKHATQEEIVNAIRQRVAGQAVAYSKTVQGQTEVEQTEYEKLQATLGERLLPAMNAINRVKIQLLDTLLKLNPAVLDSIVKFVAIGTAVSLVAGPLLLLIGFLPALAAGFGMISALILPVTAIILGIAAATFILYQVWSNNLGGIHEKTQAVFGFLGSLFSGLIQFIQINLPTALAIMQNAWQTVADFWNSYIMPIINVLIDQISKFWLEVQPKLVAALQAIVNHFNEQFQLIASIIIPIVSAISDFIKAHWSEIKVFLEVVMAGIVVALVVAWEAIKAAIMIALDIISGNWKGVWEDIKGFFLGIWNDLNAVTHGALDNMLKTVENFTSSIVKKFEDMASSITNALHSIKFPHLNIGSGSVNIAGHKIDYPTINVDWYEQGGFVPRTGLAMLHAGEFVLSKDMLSGRKSVPNYVSNTTNYKQPINIYATVNDNIDLNSLGNQLAWRLRNSR